MKKLSLFLSIVCLFVFLTACNGDDPAGGVDNSEQDALCDTKYDTREEYGFIRCTNAQSDCYAYGQYAFYKTNKDILFQNTANVLEKSVSIFYDPVSGSNASPFAADAVIRNFLVDPYSTEQNSGLPVLIIAYSYSHTDSPCVAVAEYNMKTRKLTNIADGIPSFDTKDMWLYGSSVYLVIDNGDKGDMLYMIDRRGDGVISYEHPEMHILSGVAGMNDGNIIYTSGAAYSYRPDAKEVRFICRASVNFVYDGYVYYYDTAYDSVEFEGETFFSPGYMRYSIDKSGESELFMSGILGASGAGKYLCYNKFSPHKADGETKTSDEILYLYNLESGEEKVLVDITDQNGTASLISIFNDSAIIRLFYIGADGSSVTKICHCDLETGVLTDLGAFGNR